MLKCKKCDKNFNRYTVINNIRRNLGRRVYCIDCSLFRGHNTKNLVDSSFECKLCLKVFERNSKKRHRHREHICKICVDRIRKVRIKNKCLEYKGKSCEVCGYNKSKRALVFHHEDDTKKEFGISTASGKSWNKTKAELNKCMLLCSNCHMEIHEKLESTEWNNRAFEYIKQKSGR